MSRTTALYVGPYAAWPEESVPSDEPIDRICADDLGREAGGAVAPGGTRRRPVRVVFFVPNPYKRRRRGGPSGTLHYDGEPPGQGVGADFRGLDREAEVKAFRTASAREPEAMAEAAGCEPLFGWGVIYSSY
jgi:hypothetical protein